MAAPKSVHPHLLDVEPRAVIDKTSPVPLHYQLERFLRDGIESGRFPPHETLPTEKELQDYFDLSRTPIRQAISKLVHAGLVERRRSLGTVVLPHPFEEKLVSLTSFTEEVMRKGQRPLTRLLEFAVVPADGDDVKELHLIPGAEVYHIRRVRYINEQPVGLIRSHIPVSIAPGLEPHVFAVEGERQSIYNILETVFNLKLVRALEVFHAVILDDETAVLLELPPITPVLQRDRVTFDAQGRAVASERGLYHVRYHIEWTGREVKDFHRSLGSEQI